MSRKQGDNFVTTTDKGLNNYVEKVYLPKLIGMIDEKIKEFFIAGGKIVCEQRNIVKQDGFKLNALKIVGREYFIRVYSNEKSDLADVVNKYYNAKDANDAFIFWKSQF